MPYVYAQAKDCSEHGLPMVRALFVEFPDDPGSWLVDDEYLYGSSILVAPLMHENETGRDVYLPPGTWIDYQTGQSLCRRLAEDRSRRDSRYHAGARRHGDSATSRWRNPRANGLVETRTGGVRQGRARRRKGLVFLPGDNELHELTLTKEERRSSWRTIRWQAK